jgi:hypothetical protein
LPELSLIGKRAEDEKTNDADRRSVDPAIDRPAT